MQKAAEVTLPLVALVRLLKDRERQKKKMSVTKEGFQVFFFLYINFDLIKMRMEFSTSTYRDSEISEIVLPYNYFLNHLARDGKKQKNKTKQKQKQRDKSDNKKNYPLQSQIRYMEK